MERAHTIQINHYYNRKVMEAMKFLRFVQTALACALLSVFAFAACSDDDTPAPTPTPT